MTKKILHISVIILGILVVCITIFYLFAPNFFAEGMMHGGDEAAHMFIPRYVLEYYQEHGQMPVINPYWYNGVETLHHAPSLVYIPIAIVYNFVKNIYLTNRIFTLLLLLFAGMSMFFLLYKKTNIRSAIIGGILYPFTPAIFHLSRTSVTRVMPFILLPIAIYFSDEILKKDFRFRNFLFLVLILAAMILSHPITGVSSIFFLSCYAFTRLVIDRKIQLTKLWTWLLGFFIACGLTAWFAIPFLLEPTGYSYAVERLPDSIASIQFSRILFLSGGISLLILSVISFWRTRTLENRALFISLLIALFFASPLSAPIYTLLPWGYPFAAFTWICIISLYFATTFFEFPKLNKKIAIPIAFLAIPLVITVGLISYNQNTSIFRIWAEPYDKSFPALDQAFDKFDNAGRVFYVKPASKLDWVIPAIHKKYNSEGHYFSIARLNKEIAWINDAFNNGYYKYMLNKMKLFNNRYFVYTMYAETFFNNNPELKPAFDQAFKDAEFEKYFSEPADPVRAVYYQNKPSQYFIPLEEKTLVIGSHAYDYAAFQPNSYITGSVYLDDYDLEFLKNFDNLVLYGFGYHDKVKAEKLIQDYAKSGGNVTIDMLGIKNSKLESDPTFLNVQSVMSKTNSSMQLELAENVEAGILPGILEIPSIKDFGSDQIRKAESVPLNEWRFPEYSNLDGSILRWGNRINTDNGLYSLIGYKNIDGHKIWFIGGNLFYHAYLTNDPVEQDFLKALTTRNGHTETVKELNVKNEIEITSQDLDPEAGKMEFSYRAQEDTPLLVSYAISPHWKAYINGEPIKIYNLDSMMALNLPAGQNYVKLIYKNLPNHNFAKGVSFTTIILLGGIFIFNLRKRRSKRHV
ncbi:6-pyruvoyl-tetrahydropterin synthase-related protein [Patescibacteria group bacterium]